MRFDLRNVSFSYKPKNGVGKRVFNSLGFSVNDGESVGVIGHEGVGKTSLLQLMTGLLKPDAGTILLDGVDIWRQPQSVIELRRRIGFAFQFPEQQFFCETVEEELLYAQKNFGNDIETAYLTAEDSLRLLGLEVEPYLHRSPYSLSMGEARRVAIATLLVMKPQALLLDEPTVGLDGAGVDTMVSLVRRMRDEGVTIVVVSHDIDVLAEVTSRIVIIGDGSVREDGPVQTLFRNEEVLRRHGYQLPEVVRFMREMKHERDGTSDEFYTFHEAKAWLDSVRKS